MASRALQQPCTDWIESPPNRIPYRLVLESCTHPSFQQDYKLLGVRGYACLAEFTPHALPTVLCCIGAQAHEGKADEVEKQGETPSLKAKG